MQLDNVQADSPQQSAIIMPGRSAEFGFDKELEELGYSPEWASGIARKVLAATRIFRSRCAR
jgi:hypothetical protein